MGLGFLLTVATIWIVPLLAGALGSWRWVFLVLLLVLQAEFDDVEPVRIERPCVQTRAHARFDLGAVVQHLGQRGGRVAEHVGVQPRDVDRIGLHEAAIQRVRGFRPQGRGQSVVTGGVHAHVQDRSGTAPFGIKGRGTDAQQPARAADQRLRARA